MRRLRFSVLIILVWLLAVEVLVLVHDAYAGSTHHNVFVTCGDGTTVPLQCSVDDGQCVNPNQLETVANAIIAQVGLACKDAKESCDGAAAKCSASAVCDMGVFKRNCVLAKDPHWRGMKLQKCKTLEKAS